MKDYANPLLLLIVIALLSWKVSMGIDTPATVEVWLLTLCVSGFLVNGLLSIARAMAGRRALMAVVWSVVYLIFCSCAWVSLRQEKNYRTEISAYNSLNAKWQEEGANPFSLFDSDGRSLLELATILGKKMSVRGLLAQPEAAQAGDLILKAAVSAAENGRHEMFALLNQQQQNFDFDRLSNGSTPLIAAVLSNKYKCVEALLKLQASPDMCDENGVSPIMHAVIDDNRRMARLLMSHGADPTVKDYTGRDAHSCSRTADMDEILQSRSQ